MGVMYVGDHHRISHGAPMRIMSKGGWFSYDFCMPFQSKEQLMSEVIMLCVEHLAVLFHLVNSASYF